MRPLLGGVCIVGDDGVTHWRRCRIADEESILRRTLSRSAERVNGHWYAECVHPRTTWGYCTTSSSSAVTCLWCLAGRTR